MLLRLQWVQYNRDVEGAARQRGFNAASPAMGLVLIVYYAFFKKKKGFNAASPAMGLV